MVSAWHAARTLAHSIQATGTNWKFTCCPAVTALTGSVAKPLELVPPGSPWLWIL